LEPKPKTETQLPNQQPEPEPITHMATTGPTTNTMDIDNEGKSYLKKPEPFIAVFDEDGTRDAAVTNLDLPHPTFHVRDLHNQPT
jgi:hypothetical protein